MRWTTRALGLAALSVWAAGISPLQADWSQWGGPSRDFVAAADAAAIGWSRGAPRELWRRPLGPGYSGIVGDGERLYTMTRRGEDELVVALSPVDGSTLWESAYPAPPPTGPANDTTWGSGPNSTPLLVGGRLYTLGFTGVLSCLDAATGAVAWRRDLAARHGAAAPYFGHSSSPLRFADTVIVAAGGAMAFRLDDGEPVWETREFDASYASPALWQLEDGVQLVIPAAGEIVGLDPRDGRLLWRHEHANNQRTILSGALFGDDRVLFASAYFLGSVGLELAADGGSVSSRWTSRRLQLAQSNAIRVGEVVYGFNNSILVALDLRSGEVLWRSRDFQRANLIRVGERFLLLDRLGRLSLASFGPEGPTTHAESQLLEGRSWTAPTLIGSRLYARNLETIVAVDLSGPGGAEPVLAARPGLPAVSAPAEFLEARARLIAAYQRGDAGALGAAAGELGRWADDEQIGHLAGYYRGFAAYERAQLAPAFQLALLRQAESLLEEVVARQPAFADAHALLARVYPMYYRFDPGRAAVVGSMGDDHLDSALRFEPDNPRVLAIQALDLIDSPPQYGGDPEAGRALLRRALDRFAELSDAPSTAYPEWGHASAWAWYGEVLLRAEPADREGGIAALRKALELAPELATARKALDEAMAVE